MIAVRRIPLLLALVLIVAGCGGKVENPKPPISRTSKPPTPTVFRELPPLPAQGIAVSDAKDTRLLDLSGKTIVRLRGMTVFGMPPIEFNLIGAGGRPWFLQAKRHRLTLHPAQPERTVKKIVFGSKSPGTSFVAVAPKDLPFGCFPIAKWEGSQFASCTVGPRAGSLIRVSVSGTNVLALAAKGEMPLFGELSPDGR